MSIKAIKHLLNHFVVAIAVLATGCSELATGPQTGVEATPFCKQCFTTNKYLVFIPTSEELCPDPQVVFRNFRSGKDDFNKRYKGADSSTLRRVFLDEFVGINVCIDAWFERWVPVKCNNQISACGSNDCLDVHWFCDHPAIPVGESAEQSGFPYILKKTTISSCGSSSCGNGDTDPIDSPSIEIL